MRTCAPNGPSSNALLFLFMAMSVGGCGRSYGVERIVDGALRIDEPTNPSRASELLQNPGPRPPATDPGAGLPPPLADRARLVVALNPVADGSQKVAAARGGANTALLPRLWGEALAVAPAHKAEAFMAVTDLQRAGNTLAAARLSGAVCDALVAQRNLSPGPLPDAIGMLAVDDALLFAPERLHTRSRKIQLSPEDIAVRAFLLGQETRAVAMLSERMEAGSPAAQALLALLHGRPGASGPGRAAVAEILRRRDGLAPQDIQGARADAAALGGLAAAVALARLE